MSEYALFQSSLPLDAHKLMEEVLDSTESPEDLPHDEVPDLILGDDLVHDAIRELLGEDYEPDVCRHVHINDGSPDGDWHPDDYDGNPWPEGVNFAVLFYFPQELPLEFGGTAILIDGQEIIATGPAGMCLIARGNVEHRVRANTTGKVRYMLKYLFRAEL